MFFLVHSLQLHPFQIEVLEQQPSCNKQRRDGNTMNYPITNTSKNICKRSFSRRTRHNKKIQLNTKLKFKYLNFSLTSHEVPCRRLNHKTQSSSCFLFFPAQINFWIPSYLPNFLGITQSALQAAYLKVKIIYHVYMPFF